MFRDLRRAYVGIMATKFAAKGWSGGCWPSVLWEPQSVYSVGITLALGKRE